MNSPVSQSHSFARAFFVRARAFALPVMLALFVGVCLPPPVACAQLLTARMRPDEKPVFIETAEVSTEVTGRFAVTTLDMTFRNPNSRVLEGTFEFPLLDGQRVVRFALDVSGRLREAVPVDKEKGRVVFEEIQRRPTVVDPGLVERVAGNTYRARIYPFNAGGTRRVVIAWQETLAAPAAGKAARHRVALNFSEPLKKFSLRASVVADTAGAPAKVTTTLPLELPAWRENRLLEVEKTDFAAKGVVEIELPAAGSGERNPKNQTTAVTQKFDGTEYFYAEAALPAKVAGAVRERPAPRRVGILWDASGSGRERDHAREFALLDAYFKTLAKSAGEVAVNVVFLRDTATAGGAFKVKKGKWGDLREHLENALYDGASSLDGAAELAGKITTGTGAVDEWLLFSDGLFNYGKTKISAGAAAGDPLAALGVVHTVNAAAASAPATLRAIAQRRGGEFVNLLAIDAAAGTAALRSQRPRILGVERNPEAAANIFPEIGTALPAGDAAVFAVTGILRAEKTTVRIKIGWPAGTAGDAAGDDANAKETVLHTVTLALKSGASPSTLAARAWALAKIEALSADADANAADIKRTSQTFRIVSDDTSLIVLEDINDYARYGIEPPEELRGQWRAWRTRQFEGKDAANRSHIESVVRAFEERCRWWETKFPKTRPAPVKNIENLVGSAGTSGNARGEVIGSMRSERTPLLGSPLVGAAASVGAMPPTSAPPGVSASGSIGEGHPSPQTGAPRNPRSASGSIGEGRLSYAPPERGAQMRRPSGSAAQSSPAGAAPSVSLKRWSPDAGYLDRLRRAAPAERLNVYREERAANAKTPGFYLDAADFFATDARDTAGALRVLSNLAELGLEDAPLLRVLAHRLTQLERPDLAAPIFERVLKIRAEEPQSYRDLALVLAKLGEHQRAVDLLWQVVERPWDGRFPEISLIALEELNAVAAVAERAGKPLNLAKVDPRLRRNLPLGLRVVLTWDADNCDIDLWVDDPAGERVMYSHPRSLQGGRISRDFTGGYGPEEFLLREPRPGKYTARVHYYGDRRQTALGPVTVQARIITGFGTANETEKSTTVRLTNTKDGFEIGSIEVPATAEWEAALKAEADRATKAIGDQQFHTVAAGDTGYSIARRHNLTFRQLSDLNPGVDWPHLAVGTKIRVK